VGIELRHKLNDVNAEVTRPSIAIYGPSESNLRSSFIENLESNSLLGSTLNSINETSLNKSLESSLKIAVSLQPLTVDLRYALEILEKKGVIYVGGGGYVRRYEVIHNFTGAQIDSMVTAFGIPDLNSSNFKEQLLACTGLTLAKKRWSTTITDRGNVVIPKHYQTCKNMSFQKTGKAAALLSFPGSGNSWVRQLIETTTGIYTGTYKDCDVSYICNGMIGEGVYTDNVIAVKIHFPINDLDWLYDRDIIYVVRNPFNAILADWNRQKSAIKDHKASHVSTTSVFGK